MILNIVLSVATFVGVVLTVYYGTKSAKLERAKTTLYWHDVETICDSVSVSLKRDSFKPEVILAPGLPGGILSELLVSRFDSDIPIFTGISYRYFGQTAKLSIDNYQTFNIRSDWDILIPESVLSFKDKRILIVDDFWLTGEFFPNLKRYLTTNGFDETKVKVFCAVITSVTKSSGRMPDYYSLVTDRDSFYFPWGEASIG